MRTIPNTAEIDGLPALLREGYLFLPRRFASRRTDVFSFRLAGIPITALQGREGAAIFYDASRFVRRGATPRFVQRTLFGERGVQTLDGAEHAHRKAIFMRLMARDRIDALMEHVWREWYAALDRWKSRSEIVLFDEALEVFCRAACAWAGVPLRDDEARDRARDFWAMIDGFGGLGLRQLRGRRARARTERWIGAVLDRIRSDELRAPQWSAASVFAGARDVHGKPLDPRVTGVELINVIRPIVAVATYVSFLAHALHGRSDFRRSLRSNGQLELDLFVHEVRRVYPFAPFLAARVREPFQWEGVEFPRGRRVLLDVYGTNHDPRLWDDAAAFRPERFRGRAHDPFSFIPQGGGAYDSHHRCAGEWITIEAMKASLSFLTHAIEYRFPLQDTSIDLGRMPALPRSGMILADVRNDDAVFERPPITHPEASASA